MCSVDNAVLCLAFGRRLAGECLLGGSAAPGDKGAVGVAGGPSSSYLT